MDKDNKFKIRKTSFYDAFMLLLLEPLVLSLVFFILFNRIQVIIDYSNAYPQYDFIRLVNLDMENNPIFYMFAFVIFVLWMFGKSRQINQQKRDHQELLNSINNIADEVKKNTNNINEMKSMIEQLKNNQNK